MKYSFNKSLSHSFNDKIDPLIQTFWRAHVSLKSPGLSWDVGQNMAFRLKVDHRDRSCNIHLSLVAQSCLTLCNPMDYSWPGSSVHGDFPGQNTRVGCHALLQGIVPTQRSNRGLLHCRWILYHLSHKGSPKMCLVRSGIATSYLIANLLSQEAL